MILRRSWEQICIYYLHEVILLPKLSMFEKDELVNMVKEVNTEGVAADEVLSDHVYEYNRTERLITM
jgi:hypothetical protein